MMLLASLLAFIPSVQQGPPPLFQPAEASLVLPSHTAGDNWSYLDLVEDYLRITGQQFYFTAETRQELERAHSTLNRVLEVAPAEVQDVFERFLAMRGFALVPDSSRHEAQVHTLLGLGGRSRGFEHRGSAIPIVPEAVQAYERHSAVLVECLLPTGALGSIELSNYLRGIVTRSGLNQITALPDAQAVLLTGRGPEVAHYARVIQRAAGLHLLPESGLRPEHVAKEASWPLVESDPSAEPTFYDLLASFEIETGVYFLVDESPRLQLKTLRPGMALPETLSSLQVQSFLERLLVLNGFSIEIARFEAPALWQVRLVSHPDRPRTWIPNRIDPSTLGSWRDHPAIHLRTEFSTGAMPASALANSMRGLITNAREEYFVPLGKGTWIAAAGFGPGLASRSDFIAQAGAFVVEEPAEDGEEEESAPDPAKKARKSDFNPLGGR